MICRSSDCSSRVRQFGYLRRVEDLTQAETETTVFEPAEHLEADERINRAVAILVDEDVITPELFESISEAASKIKLDSSIKPAQWRKMAEELRQEGHLNSDYMKDVKRFAADVRSYHSQLHRDFREADYEDETINRELENVHVFLQEFEQPRRRYLEAASQVALEAVAGASFGPGAAVAAYVAWSQPSQAEIDNLLVELEALRAGRSDLILGGNKVEAVHQEELWQAMNGLLDEAIESAKAGQPVEINAQYFELTSDEFVGKLAEAAQAGCKLRVNIDPSRPRTGGVYGMSVDDGPRKMRALLQLASLEGADVGVSVFPVHRELGSLSRLMHRKMLRVGDRVLLSGMNANKGSGENVDAGYIIEGPAARRLTEIFSRDVGTSVGASPVDVFGEAAMGKVLEGDVSLTAFGMAHLLDALAGPSPAGRELHHDPPYSLLSEMAEQAGYHFPELFALPEEELQTKIDSASTRRKTLPLSDTGKAAFAEMANKVFSVTNDRNNVERLRDIKPPEGREVGRTRVGIADLPAEREALMLHSISEAEEFVYIPAFVLTRAVARALAARSEELKTQGKKLDVKVIVDSGIYPFGGTPNSYGVLALENADLPVRWSLLARTTPTHDRKIHAKQIITDKMEFFGSTNLSQAGMQENWELSGVVFFDPEDDQSMAERQESVDDFMTLWNRESFSLDTRKVALKRLPVCETRDCDMRREEARHSAIKSLLARIRIFERESAEWMQTKIQEPEVAQLVEQNRTAGLAEGYAVLEAVRTAIGEEEFYRHLSSLESMTKLRSLRRYG